MRDDICTIPVSEVFEENDGCPICRMHKIVEERILDYILGDAMMEPDVRIETNRVGFCKDHYDKMFNRRGRLQLALMLKTHVDEINKNVFSKNIFMNAQKRSKAAAEISENCFVCDKIEFGISRMIKTIYRCYEREADFRNLFNNQDVYCLPHYERLISEADKREMPVHYKDFVNNITRITNEYSEKLSENIKDFCSVYDYRANKDINNSDCKDAVEKTIAFLDGRYYRLT